MKLTILLASSAAAAAAVDEYADHPFVRGGIDHRELQPQLITPCNDGLLQGPCCGLGVPLDPCWCDRSGVCPRIDICPDYPSTKIYTPSPINPYNGGVADFFSSLGLPDNTDYAHLQLCHPKLSCGFNDPYLLYSLDILDEELVKPCSKLRSGSKGSRGNSQQCYGKGGSDSSSGKCDNDKGKGNEVCGIKFKHCVPPDPCDPFDCHPPDPCTCTDIVPESHDEDCGTPTVATNYEIMNFKNDKTRQRAGYFVLHEGACGVCSTAQDIAAYMKYSFPLTRPPLIPVTLETITIRCYIQSGGYPPPAEPVPAPDLVESIKTCIANETAANFTENCAFAWAINMFMAGLNVSDGGCTPTPCDSPSIPIPPYNNVTCELDDCLACDEEVNGETFTELAGMTRRGAGIHTALPRPCGSLTEHNHTCVSAVPELV